MTILRQKKINHQECFLDLLTDSQNLTKRKLYSTPIQRVNVETCRPSFPSEGLRSQLLGLEAGLFKARLSENFCSFSARSSLYTFCPSVLSMRYLKLHKTQAMDNNFVHEKLSPRLTFNPGLLSVNRLSKNPAQAHRPL